MTSISHEAHVIFLKNYRKYKTWYITRYIFTGSRSILVISAHIILRLASLVAARSVRPLQGRASRRSASHCWRVSPYAVLLASGRTIEAEQMFLIRIVKKPHSVLTHPSARFSFHYQDNLRQQCSEVVLFPAAEGIFVVQTSCGAFQGSYTVDIVGCFPWCKATRARIWQSLNTLCQITDG
jgi:hypothetical protein